MARKSTGNITKKKPASKRVVAKGPIKSIADVDAHTARYLSPAFTKELTAHIQRATKKAVSQSKES